MKVMVTGSRSFKTTPYAEQVHDALASVLESLHPSTLIQGGAPGPDTWAAIWASGHESVEQIMVRPVQLPGETYGQACYRRNIIMLDLQPDVLVACWDGQSKGTQHTVIEGLARGVPLVQVRADLVKRVYDLEREVIRLRHVVTDAHWRLNPESMGR